MLSVRRTKLSPAQRPVSRRLPQDMIRELRGMAKLHPNELWAESMLEAAALIEDLSRNGNKER
jgi:hypothetical protein